MGKVRSIQRKNFESFIALRRRRRERQMGKLRKFISMMQEVLGGTRSIAIAVLLKPGTKIIRRIFIVGRIDTVSPDRDQH